jgi:hypothetical protein
MEKELKKQISNPTVFISALKDNKFGITHDSFISKILQERKNATNNH